MDLEFNYNEQQVRTVSDENGEIWFSGVDVCNILDYKNVSDIMRKNLDEDEKKLTYLTDRSGQQRETWTINESGLYSLILTSSKLEAKPFKRWVTHEVLPAIRKAGRFTTEQAQDYDAMLQYLATEIQTLKTDKDDHQSTVNELRKKIEEKTYEMLRLIKEDRTQMKLEFPIK